VVVSQADYYTFFYGNGNTNHDLRPGVFVHEGITSIVKMIKFISDRILYIIRSFGVILF